MIFHTVTIHTIRIPTPLKSFSFHSYEFNKVKTFTNLRLEKYYQSYSFITSISLFRFFFPYLAKAIIPLSPKRILKKKITIPSSKTSPSSFSKLSDFSYSCKQIQETFTQPLSLLQISLCLSFQL